MKVMVAVLFLVGCGGGAETPACPPPLFGSCTNHSGLFCTEYAGVPEPAQAAVMSSCKGDPGEPDVWSTSGCSHAGALGACRSMQGAQCAAVWLKLPVSDANTRAEAIRMCTMRGGTWVEP
jgi:hypothetical protein